jgi:broad specificity phosphatase PhoE
MARPEIEKTVYFVRHGESEDNTAPVFQSPDSPLSERGRKQTDDLAARVSQLSFEALIASPFQRARQTAEAITRITGMTAEYSELFVERIKPTSINGKPYTDETAHRVWRAWEKSLHTPNMRVEDGENFDDLLVRADKALGLLKDRLESSIVVVTHGYFLRTVLARALLRDLLTGEIFRRFQRAAAMENTGLTVLRHHGGADEESPWRLWTYNDHAHLG